MKRKKKKGRVGGVIIALIIISIPGIYSLINTLMTPSMEKVRRVMEEHLLERYGEEFVVGEIGTRMFKDTEYYQARIYPKSIIGTNKAGDTYYYAEVNVDRLSFGRLRKPGDTYGQVQVRVRCEEFLMPKVKELFGERVKIKPEIDYYRRNMFGSMAGYLSPDFDEILENSIKDPENHRLELELYIYIFDRIDDDAEKEERRQQIFDFVQYLKREGLFEYLELGVIFIDERVLAPSYREYRDKIYSIEEETEVEGEIVYLPPEDFRREMSEVLQKEVEQMSEDEILERIDRIKKSELSYRGLEKYNAIFFSMIYSKGMLNEKYKTSLEKNPNLSKEYIKISDIKILENLEYIYLE